MKEESKNIEPSPEQQKIAKLKEQYGTVYELKIPVNDEGDFAIGYLKKPNRQVLSAAIAFAESDPLKSNDIILTSCWIEGDERILKDDEINFSAINSLQGIINIRRGELKKI